MDRASVSSSNIKSVGYDPKTKTLEVEFHTGAVHQYQDVSPQKHKAMMRAKSIGGYFSVNVRNFHKANQVT
jgi:hypothetical protein